MKHLATLRLFFGIVALGAAYVFWINAGTNPDIAVLELRGASQVMIAFSFFFLIVYAPRILPKQRELVEKALMWIVGFFMVSNSLSLLLYIERGSIDDLSVISGKSVTALLVCHVLSIIIIPTVLWLALNSVICRISEPKKKINRTAYWAMIILALIGLAYISLTPTWTVM